MSYQFLGANTGDFFGYSIATAGDVDGDGIEDFLFASPFMDGSGAANSGEVFLISGRELHQADIADGLEDGIVSSDLSLLVDSMPQSYRFLGSDIGDNAGFSVSALGDIDGDGLDDLLIGAPGSDADSGNAASEIGEVYVISGADLAQLDGLDRTDSTIHLGNVPQGSNSYTIYGISSPSDEDGNFGQSLSGVGDFDGDGVVDFMVGAPDYENGSIFLISGSRLSDADALDGSIDGRIDISNLVRYTFTGTPSGIADSAGSSLSSIGDIDRDGVVDFIIGAPSGDSQGNASGEIYVISGSELASLDAADGASDSQIDLANVADATNSYMIGGVDNDDHFGAQISSIVDVNGDNFGDFLVSAPTAGPGVVDDGTVYLISGNDLGQLDSLDGATDGVGDARLINDTQDSYEFTTSQTGTNLGSGLEIVEDINGDGLADLIIGGRSFDANGIGDSGIVYIVSGAQLDTADVSLDGVLDGTILLDDIHQLAGSYQITGTSGRDYFGADITSIDDVDGDGMSELIISAPGADGSSSSSGVTYIVYSSELDFYDALDGSLDGSILAENIVPACFVRGTKITTDGGEKRVEDIVKGDRVWTLDKGYEKVLWVGSSCHIAEGKFAPIYFPKNTIGNHSDLLVSPLHKIFFSNNMCEIFLAESEFLVAAKHLVGKLGIQIQEGGTVQYFHILTETHSILSSNGTLSESFFPGEQALSGLSEQQRIELCDCIHELSLNGADGYRKMVRPEIKAHEAKLLQSEYEIQLLPFDFAA